GPRQSCAAPQRCCRAADRLRCTSSITSPGWRRCWLPHIVPPFRAFQWPDSKYSTHILVAQLIASRSFAFDIVRPVALRDPGMSWALTVTTGPFGINSDSDSDRVPKEIAVSSGHTAIVTGANHGIGAATAKALARQGCAVLCTYLRVDDPVDPG